MYNIFFLIGTYYPGSGFAPKIGYPKCPDLDSKISDPSKPDPNILIFKFRYFDPNPYFKTYYIFNFINNYM